MKVTLGKGVNSADICRQNGWKAGTRLVGDEGHGPEVIRITAVGDEAVLAIAETRNGVPVDYGHESSWSLEYRDWKEVTAPLSAQ